SGVTGDDDGVAVVRAFGSVTLRLEILPEQCRRQTLDRPCVDDAEILVGAAVAARGEKQQAGSRQRCATEDVPCLHHRLDRPLAEPQVNPWRLCSTPCRGGPCGRPARAGARPPSPPCSLAALQPPDHPCTSSAPGSSTRSLIRTRNRTASDPSTMRWS